ncbi:MAG: hypothetical protein E7K72_26810, partial [Roseomonas mucosa]|nr:hypothetical protein [Roseomonas mucosa]
RGDRLIQLRRQLTREGCPPPQEKGRMAAKLNQPIATTFGEETRKQLAAAAKHSGLSESALIEHVMIQHLGQRRPVSPEGLAVCRVMASQYLAWLSVPEDDRARDGAVAVLTELAFAMGWDEWMMDQAKRMSDSMASGGLEPGE